ncbi:bifunctional metallophosphatase/5'-nucleotidase [Actinomadura oligospora]|uniref:bifunctional metallophosphatase/5'-nucleotidase n=1 Tax=Actinomadura oligospora TaxID=111804 RepID=UPI0012F9FE32|nr:bifunctional metallophosphatase/5'-nucleotidase [Actinomadura oligospora]
MVAREQRDCGDFFEGSGYYVLGGGAIEAALLAGLYDVIAPGNHGYAQHVRCPELREITVCSNVTGPDGESIWPPLVLAEIGERRVAVTAVLGVEAFTSIPPADRIGHQIDDPAVALRRLHRRWSGRVDCWIVLSHAGFAHDLALAHACPFADVIFAGHCHDPRTGPDRTAGGAVVRGAELAVGYALARPGAHGWSCAVERFPTTATGLLREVPTSVSRAVTTAAMLREQLNEVLGPLDRRFADRTPDRREVLDLLAAVALAITGAQVVMLNHSSLREAPLRTTCMPGTC